MPTPVLGSSIFEVIPTIQASGLSGGDPLTVSQGGTIPSLLGGSGAPSTAPTYGTGSVYYDVTNYNTYIYQGAAWHQLDLGGVTSAIAGTGISVSGATGAVTFTNTGVTSVSGTANQISASASTGAVTLSVPNNPIWPGTASETIPSGTTAQRPATPTSGMVRYNTTEDILEGYAIIGDGYTGGNSLTDVIAFQRTNLYRKRRYWYDEFMIGSSSNQTAATRGYGEMNWTVQATATPTNSQIAPTTDHPGILSLGTNNTSGSVTYMYQMGAANTANIIHSQVEYFSYLIQIPTITSMTLYIGLGQNIGAASFGTDAVFFQFAPGTSANWQFFTRAGSTNAVSGGSTAIAVAAGTWYLLEAWYNGTNWVGSVNGTVFAVQTTTFPVNPLQAGVYITNTATGTRNVYIDAFSMITRELGNRY